MATPSLHPATAVFLAPAPVDELCFPASNYQFTSLCDHAAAVPSGGCRYTNFELGTRVPLIIRAPGMPASHGAIAEGLAELVDVYPTLAELAGTPVPTDHLDGVSLLGFFEDPNRTTLSTRPEQGTRNKTLAFSQYPHASVPTCPAVTCPFYRDGRCHPAPASASTAQGDLERVDSFNNNTWMG